LFPGVRSIWLTAFEVDRQIDKLIQQKERTSHTVVDGSNNTSFNKQNKNNKALSKPAPKISIFQLVKSIVPKDQAGILGLENEAVETEVAKP